MAEQLYFVQRAYNLRLIAFVLMNNHFHLIVQTPDANLDLAMGWFMRETSRSIARASNRINHVYGGRYFRSVLSSEQYLLNAYKYVYANPKIAGAVGKVLDYPYSSLPGLLGLTPLLFPIHDEILTGDVEATLAWLDQVPDTRDWDSVRRALRRKVFRLPTKNKARHRLEQNLL